STSHKPPRSDGYRTKRVQPALPKEQRAAGGQVGHNGKTLHMVEKPDTVTMHLPERCAVCRRAIAADEAHDVVSKRQVVDVPEPKLDVTEHRLGHIICCGQPPCGRYPSEVSAPVHDGPGVRALVTNRSVDHKLPLAHSGTLLSDRYGYEVNSETVAKALAEGYALSEPLEAQTTALLTQAQGVHGDETGVRVGGRWQWLHTACNALSTHRFVHEQRGEGAVQSESSIVPTFRGRAMHDHLAASYGCAQAQPGACNAPILRERHGLSEEGSAWGNEMHAFWWERYQQALPLSGEAAGQARQR
ncbi:MAG: IS66 family transposase, partial [Anaerolineae bacterium]